MWMYAVKRGAYILGEKDVKEITDISYGGDAHCERESRFGPWG